MTPEEQLAKILKQNQNIVFGKTIGTDADGNCTVQTDNGAILARSPDQISAGSCVALKTDEGQWYAVSARQTGSVQRSVLFSKKERIVVGNDPFFGVELNGLRVDPFLGQKRAYFEASKTGLLFNPSPDLDNEERSIHNQNFDGVSFIDWGIPDFPTEDIETGAAGLRKNGVWFVTDIDPDDLSYEYSADNDFIIFNGDVSSDNCEGVQIFFSFFVEPEEIQSLLLETYGNSLIEANDTSIIEIELIPEIEDVFSNQSNFSYSDGLIFFSSSIIFAPQDITSFAFQFRYRKRGEANWFQL